MKILVVRIGHDGDTVMMTPALTALFQHYPEAYVTLLVSPAGKYLLKNFHTQMKNKWAWNGNGILKPFIDKKSIQINYMTLHYSSHIIPLNAKAIIQRNVVLFTPYAWAMHLVSALGIKIAALFSMKDTGDCAPYMELKKFISLRSEDALHPEKGTNTIDIDAIYSACNKLLPSQ